MALQIVVSGQNIDTVSSQLRVYAASCEVFAVSSDLVGISIATKELDQEEENIQNVIKKWRYYDLWSGNWEEPSGD